MRGRALRKLFCFTILFALAHLSAAQSNLTSRVYTYDGTTATNGTMSYDVNNTTVTQSASGNNQIISATDTTAVFLVKTVIVVRTYVQLSGNFGGDYTISGPGTTTDSARTFDISIRTNRALTFSTSGFTTLRNSLNAPVSVGTILYGLTIYQSFPAGTQVGSPITGTDTAFNSKSVSLALTDLPSDGTMTLRLSRTMTINQTAVGGQTYNATGTIVLAAN